MFGYYGKIPAQGDFIRRRADVDFVKAWDMWLQAGISASREHFGARWTDVYQNMPIWRFCLVSNICGNAPIIGVLMPSQDSVGRFFPLTIFKRLKTEVGHSALSIEPFMSNLENIALAALGEGPSRDRLEHSLDALQTPEYPLPDGEAKTYWRSTYFGGKEQISSRQYQRLPPANQFRVLMDLVEEENNV